MKVYRPHPNILAFYDGRVPRDRLHEAENWFDDGAMDLGICSYAIVDGDEALVYDTHASIDQAMFVRRTLEASGIARMVVVLSHWHADHVAGNEVFADCEIIANEKTRDLLRAHAGDLRTGLPPIDPLVMPTTTFAGSRRMVVGRLTVELRQADIHSVDGTVILLPEEGVLLAGDTLEDPVTYVAEPERLAAHLADLRAMLDWPLSRILPNHGAPDVIASGGYPPSLVVATIAYVEHLLDPATRGDTRPLAAILADAFAAGDLIPYSAYEAVHRRNRAQVDTVQSTRR